jgi:hypothetical protein
MFSRRHYVAIAGAWARQAMQLVLELDSPDFGELGFRGAISGNEAMYASHSEVMSVSTHSRPGEKQ